MLKNITLFSAILALLFATIAHSQTVPPAPENLTVEQTLNGAKLQWDEVSGILGYRVYKSIDTFPFVRISQTNVNHCVDPLIPPGHVYRYYVTAFNNYAESLPSNDVLFIPGQINPPNRARGLIQGMIIDDSTSNPIPGVRLRFFDLEGLLYFREARTDSLGFYSIHIDTGSYYIYASKWPYIPEWYDNSLKFEYATPVYAVEGDTVVANFGLTRIPPPPQVLGSISGTVTEQGNNQPIENAFVVVMRSNRQITMMQNYEGSMFGHREETFTIPGFGTLLGVMRVTKTDANGNYKLNVPVGLSYIVLSFKAGYIPEFYNEQTNFYDADRILLHGDTTGINFTLELNPDVQNSLAGRVVNEEGFGVMSKVILFAKSQRAVYPIRCTITDTSGNYSFNYLYSKYYYVKAIPFQEYAPAWYSTDSCGVMCWVHADSFYVENNTTGIDICVKPIIFGGLASIRGTVLESTNSSSIQGVTVYAVDPLTNSAVAYDITENDGSFEILNLAPGSYRIIADKEGYSTNDEPLISVDFSNSFTMDQVEVSISSLTLDVEDKISTIPDGFILNQNYPNPFNPITEITFGVPTSSRVIISVYTVLGQKVVDLVEDNFSAGTYSIPWNGTDNNGNIVSTGIYFYKLSAQPLNGTTLYTQVRKMMLAK